MIDVVGVRFKPVGKVYYFSPDKSEYELEEKVIVETARGTECGEIAIKNFSIKEEDLISELKPVIRKATPEDLKKVENNISKQKEAFSVCREKIIQHGLEMKLIDVEYTFDGSKILFYFTAEGRIDFRLLAKDLASVFKTRIELRQIGVRDEAKLIGGLGVCGREFCCSCHMGEFLPVSIKMAKEQSLSLNPVKISGSCGRLMCCLKHEEASYDYLLKTTPGVGALVETGKGRGRVVDSNIITGVLKIVLDKSPELAPVSLLKQQVKLIKNAKLTLKKEEEEALKDIEDK